MNIWSNRRLVFATGVLTLVILVLVNFPEDDFHPVYSKASLLKYAKIICLFATVATPLIYAMLLLSSGFARLVHVDWQPETGGHHRG